MLQFDLGNSSADVARLANNLNRFSGELRTMGSLMERLRDDVGIPATRDNLTTGSGWEPLHEDTPSFPKRRGMGHKADTPLIVTGRLFRAAQAKARWKIDSSIGDLFVPYNTFSSNVPYGAMQHEGGVSALTGGDVPGRPFFYLTQGDIGRAEVIVNNWILENFNKTIGTKANRTTVMDTVQL